LKNNYQLSVGAGFMPALFKKTRRYTKMKKISIIITIICISTLMFGAQFYPDIRPGYGVTETKWLSDYFEPLKGTNLDTPIFIMEGEEEGATFLLMGGTHAREIATSMSAITFIENAEVSVGRVIVMPFSNSSGASVHDTSSEQDHFIQIESKSGPRFIVYGDRRTDPADQNEADPEIFVHYPSGMELENGEEARNLNRAYPGKADGNGTQQLAYAILEMIKQENVDFNLDMHESDTPRVVKKADGSDYYGGRLAYMLVCHPRGLEIGAISIMMMEDEGIPMNLEESNSVYRGLSHREIGDNSDCISFLSESPNPGQDRNPEKKDVISDPDFPLEHRVGMHLNLVSILFDTWNMFSDKQIMIENLPTHDELMASGIGDFLN
jgi:hypothetical protein